MPRKVSAGLHSATGDQGDVRGRVVSDPALFPSLYNSRWMSKATILVVDDEQLIRWSLVERLSQEGYQTREAATGREALERFEEGVDLVLLDYRLPDSDGLTILKEIRRQDPDTLVILLTAFSSIDMAVAVMKQGAYHYATKPFNLDEIVLLVEKALETTQLRREVRALRASQAQPYGLERIIGTSAAMEAVKDLLRKVAASPASTVLLTGESGTVEAGLAAQRFCSPGRAGPARTSPPRRSITPATAQDGPS